MEKNAIALERECGRDLVGPHTNISRAQDSHRGWFYGYGFSDGEPRICLKDEADFTPDPPSGGNGLCVTKTTACDVIGTVI